MNQTQAMRFRRPVPARRHEPPGHPSAHGATMKTIQQINEKIRAGAAVVVTAEEIIDIVEEKGKETWKRSDADRKRRRRMSASIPIFEAALARRFSRPSPSTTRPSLRTGWSYSSGCCSRLPTRSSTSSSTKIGASTRTARAIASLGRESISMVRPFCAMTMFA